MLLLFTVQFASETSKVVDSITDEPLNGTLDKCACLIRPACIITSSGTTMRRTPSEIQHSQLQSVALLVTSDEQACVAWCLRIKADQETHRTVTTVCEKMISTERQLSTASQSHRQ